MKAIVRGDGHIDLRPESGAEEFVLRRLADGGYMRVSGVSYESNNETFMGLKSVSITTLSLNAGEGLTLHGSDHLSVGRSDPDAAV